mgnify:CR=1 FL=1
MLSLTVFYFLLEDTNNIPLEDIDYYNQRLDSVIRNLICQGFLIKNFQDGIQWD